MRLELVSCYYDLILLNVREIVKRICAVLSKYYALHWELIDPLLLKNSSIKLLNYSHSWILEIQS